MDAALLSSFDSYSSFAWPTPTIPTPVLPGSGQPPFPANILGVRVMLAFGADPAADPETWSWTDVSSYVQYDQRIRVKRGKLAEERSVEASRCELRLRNPAGIFSPRNIHGPYYGRLALNTPLRVDINPGTGWHTRFTGLVSSWQPRRDITGSYRWVPVEAYGRKRRLGQGQSPLRSSLHRATLDSGPVAYWTLEDASGSDAATSALPGGTAMTVVGAVTFGASLRPTGSDGACDLSSGGRLWARTGLAAGTTTSWEIEACIGWTTTVPTVPASSVGLAVVLCDTPASSFARLGIGLSQTGGNRYFSIYHDNGQDVLGTSFNTVGVDPVAADRVYHLRAVFEQVGSDIYHYLWIDDEDQGLANPDWGFGETLGRPILVRINPTDNTGQPNSVSHVPVWAPRRSVAMTYDAFGGYDGELAAVRYARLASENGIPASVPVATVTEAMGPQPADTLPNALRECETTDETSAPDRLDGRLGFDPRALRYNRPVTMTLDWAAHDLASTPAAVDDDLAIRNDVTVTRRDGSSGRVVRGGGPLGTDAIDVYDEGVTENLTNDDQAIQHAGWRSHLGTVDEVRLPAIHINLARNPELVTQWLAMDIGHRYTITNPSEDDLPPEPVDQIMEGYTEVLDQLMWDVYPNGTPSSPFEVLQIQNGISNRSRIAAGASTLYTTYGPADTEILVNSTDVRWVDSATYPTRFPFTITIAGEVMTCTAITETGITQVFTVVRALYGTAKTLPGGSAVQIHRPAAIAL